MRSESGLAELDDIEESFETNKAEGKNDSLDSVDVGEAGPDDLEANLDAPEPSSLAPPEAFRCEKCGVTFQDEGALMEHLQHCASDEAVAKAPQTKAT